MSPHPGSFAQRCGDGWRKEGGEFGAQDADLFVPSRAPCSPRRVASANWTIVAAVFILRTLTCWQWMFRPLWGAKHTYLRGKFASLLGLESECLSLLKINAVEAKLCYGIPSRNFCPPASLS